MFTRVWTWGVATWALVATGTALGQPYGKPDQGEPGDAMIQAYMASQAKAIDDRFLDGVNNVQDWERIRPRLHREFLEMLGLWPEPARSPLEAKVTGTVKGEGFVVENLHYQSVPGLYVTGNLYRPANVDPGVRLPAIFYVCGHTPMGRDGNKTAFQSHGIWFARHGYVCLVVDTLQLGEIPGIHHGTYREGRWWWLSRGYTSAGVECWNGVRGIDYLVSRPDVDPERIGVTGISGGGAATFWIAAADERVKVAVPVSGMADLESYVGNRVVNGHCDCMFLHNAHRWPWTRIAALVAPRPLLFVNSDQDAIFPMDANERVIARLERFYSLFGAGDLVDAVVSVGGHDYRRDIRRAVARFLNLHLKGVPGPVNDSEIDLVAGPRGQERYPIEPSKLRVFPRDADVPRDAKNGSIDQTFVPAAVVDVPAPGAFAGWKKEFNARLRDHVFSSWPRPIPAAKLVSEADGVMQLETEPGIVLPLRRGPRPAEGSRSERILLVVSERGGETAANVIARAPGVSRPGDDVVHLEPRGVGATRWTHKDPPNYVTRAHVLIGQTPDSGRLRDIVASARWLMAKEHLPVVVVGTGASGVLAAFAAVLEPELAGVIAVDPPASLMDRDAPVVLNALRVLDVPELLGMIAPRELILRGGSEPLRAKVRDIYQRADPADRLGLR